MERFSLSDLQAQAILEMQLRRLQGLEKEKSMRNMQNCKRRLRIRPFWRMKSCCLV